MSDIMEFGSRDEVSYVSISFSVSFDRFSYNFY